MSTTPDLRGALMCACATTILGVSVPISRVVLDYPVVTGQAGRYALAAAVLLAIGWVRSGRWPWQNLAGWRDWLRLGALALTGLVVFNLLLLTALRHADAAVVGTVLGGMPLVMALVAPITRREWPAMRLITVAGVMVVGGALVQGGGHADAIGWLAALGTLAGQMLFSLLAVPLLPRLGALRVSTLSCLLAVPMLAVAAVAAGEVGQVRMPTGAEAAGYAHLGGLLTVVAVLVWYSGLGRLGPARAGLFVGLLPLASLATAAVLDWRQPIVLQVGGVLLVAAGLALGISTRTPSVSPAPGRAGAHRLAAIGVYPVVNQGGRIQAAPRRRAGGWEPHPVSGWQPSARVTTVRSGVVRHRLTRSRRHIITK